jgi:hypothetical protein
VTLESAMEEYQNVIESFHPSKSKAKPKGSVMLVATPPPKRKRFPKQIKNAVASEVSKDISQLIVTRILRTITRSQDSSPMKR